MRTFRRLVLVGTVIAAGAGIGAAPNAEAYCMANPFAVQDETGLLAKLPGGDPFSRSCLNQCPPGFTCLAGRVEPTLLPALSF